MVHLEDKGLPHRPRKCPALEVSLVKAWDKITAETVRAACAQFKDRLRRVVAAKGGHFE